MFHRSDPAASLWAAFSFNGSYRSRAFGWPVPDREKQLCISRIKALSSSPWWEFLLGGWRVGSPRGKGFGLIGNLIVGLLGAFIGGWLFQRLHIHLGAGIVALIVNALVGATVLIFLLWLIGGSGWRHRGWGYGRWGRRW